MAHLLDASPELAPGCNHLHTITKGARGLCVAGLYLAGLAYTESQELCKSDAYCSSLKNFYYILILWGF